MSQRLIARIKKLLSLAQSDNEHESATALRKARQLMLEHAISQADLNEADRESDPIIAQSFTLVGGKLVKGTEKARYSGARTQQWLRDLFFAIASYMDMKATYVKSSNVVDLYGYTSDVAVISYLYDSVAQQINTAWKAYNLVRPDREWVHGKTAGASYKQSAVLGLRNKLNALKVDQTNVETPQGTTAIALTRKNAVNQWYNEHIAAGVKTFRVKRASYDSAGYNTGKNVRLNAGVAGTQTKRIA